MQIDYLAHKSFIGFVIMGATSRGFCWVDIGDSKRRLLVDFKEKFKGENLREVPEGENKYLKKLITYLEGRSNWEKLHFDVNSTNFKIKVWRYMQTIPAGETRFYSQIAEAIGKPKAYRAVASACATNPVSLVVPCHRVIPRSGGIGKFGPGLEKKQKLLDKEGL